MEWTQRVNRDAHNLHGTKKLMVGKQPLKKCCLKCYGFCETSPTNSFDLASPKADRLFENSENTIMTRVSASIFLRDSDERLVEFEFSNLCYFMVGHIKCENCSL